MPSDRKKPRKLTADDVREIRRLIREGIAGHVIAKRFDVTQSCVSQIKSGRSWPVYERMVTCRQCGETRTVEAVQHGISPYCSDLCFEESQRRQQRDFDLRRRFGITLDDYEAMLADQCGVCAVCGLPERGSRNQSLAVDHDHSTGRVRGLLCGHCNRAVGLFGDDPKVFRKAIKYLRGDRQPPMRVFLPFSFEIDQDWHAMRKELQAVLDAK